MLPELSGCRWRCPAMVEAVSVVSCRRPTWFDPAIKTVLDGASELDTVSGPGEFEQVTVELR
jgi:hypothetical protein